MSHVLIWSRIQGSPILGDQLQQVVFAGGPLRVELDEGSELSGGNVLAEVSLVLPAGLKEEVVEKMRRCVKSEL